MTIQEIKNDCIFIGGVTNSSRVQSAMALVLLHFTTPVTVVTVRSMRWIVPLLYDMAVYAGQYGDPDVADWLDDAADGLREHLDACTNRPG
jgi:hypothetical protein